MKLEEVTAEIRPRVPWESIDLGCALARRHIVSLWKAWALTIFPLWIILGLLLQDHPIWFIFCTWWLKPIYDRVPLFVVSRALFGAVPSVKDVMKAWPKLLVKRLWFSLVVGRFSPARSLTLPISELEGLKGKSYRQRVTLLERNGGEGAAMATFAGMLLEFVAGFGLVMLVFMMVPAAVSERWWQGIGEFFEYNDFEEVSSGLIWMVALVRLLSFTIMEPFYVSAGFALYINSRTLTEGWDIELAFKRMTARLVALKNGVVRSGGVALILLVILFTGFTLQSTTGQSVEQTQIEEILADKDFTVHHQIDDVPVSKKGSPSASNANLPVGILSIFGRLVFYLILIALVVGLGILIYKNRHIFQSEGLNQSSEKRTKTREIMGMNVTPESLPDDIVASAREAWEAGDYKRALSYLYRGSIASLIHRSGLLIVESDTEGDCLLHVQTMNDSQVTPYFSQLTRAWTSVAYGKKNPEDITMRELCDSWPFDPFEQQGRSSS